MKLFALPLLLATVLLPGAAAAQSASTLDEIKARGSIRVGFRAAEPPMSFRDSDGAAVGYTIDICNRIAEATAKAVHKSDLKIEYVEVHADDRFEAVNDKRIDILCGSTTKTLSRQEIVDFTQLTFVTGAALLSLTSSPISHLPDLAGKKLAVVEKTTTIEVMTKALEKAGVKTEIVPVKNALEGAEALETGKVDAYTSDQVVLVGLVLSARNPENFVVSAELFSFEPFALAVRRNDADFRLVADRVIAGLYRSGEIIQIYRNWFGNVSSNLPGAVEAMFALGATPK